ncbi:MAG: hypothetical protein R2741_03010 [Methanolobus sp.]
MDDMIQFIMLATFSLIIAFVVVTAATSGSAEVPAMTSSEMFGDVPCRMVESVHSRSSGGVNSYLCNYSRMDNRTGSMAEDMGRKG